MPSTNNGLPTANCDPPSDIVAERAAGGRHVLVLGSDSAPYYEALRRVSKKVATSEDEGARRLSQEHGPARRDAAQANGEHSAQVATEKYDVIVLTEKGLTERLWSGAGLAALSGRLTDDGYLIVVAANLDAYAFKLTQLAGANMGAGSDQSLARLNEATLRRVIESSGFELGHLEPVEDSPAEARAQAARFCADGPVLEHILGEASTLASHYVAVAFPSTGQGLGVLKYRSFVVEAEAGRIGLDVSAIRDASAATAAQVRALSGRLDTLSERLDTISTDADGFVGGPRLAESVAELSEKLKALKHVAGAGGTWRAVQDASYQRTVRRVRGAIAGAVPRNANVLVVSKGDEALIDIRHCRASHFPVDSSGVYAGHHPADSEDALERLKECVERGAQYIVFPETSAWWLYHYTGLSKHLDDRCRKIIDHQGACAIFALAEKGSADE